MPTNNLPRAFLSHSSLDKPFVAKVFQDLGPTLAELDEATFEPAKFTRQVILRALDRCGLFVLFASAASLTSDWVALEIAEALSRIKDNRINRVIVYCSDKSAFAKLLTPLRDYNIVRIEKTPLVCARQIRGVLAEISAETPRADLFISRDENLAEMKRLVINPDKSFRTLAVSGFDRLGRRSVAQKFCRDIYGAFTPPTISVTVEASTSLDDIYRQLLRLQHGALDRTDLISKSTNFARATQPDQIAEIGREIRSLNAQREFVQFVDAGGIVGDDGDLSTMFQAVHAQNADITDLIHILILFRSAPAWVQKKYPDIAFYRLPPLSDAQTEITILHELKKRRAHLTKEQIAILVSNCDGHPANLDYIIGYIFDSGILNKFRLEEVLSGSSEFANFKRDRASAYIGKFPYSDLERTLVALLSGYRTLSSEALAAFAQEEGIMPSAVGAALARLFELNIIDADGDQYRLIRPLRDSLERDSRFNIDHKISDRFASVLTSILDSYGSQDAVPISLIDSGTIAAIRNGSVASGWASQLVLPSHYIWLAREAYHGRQYRESLDFSRRAQQLSSTMTDEAKLECLRFEGLSCARLGLDADLAGVVRKIDKTKSKRSTGNKHFLLGFAARLRGDLPSAQVELEKAARVLKGSIDVQREIIGVLLARKEYEQALAIAEELVSRAEDNAFVLDGYIQAKVATSVSIESLDYDRDFKRRLGRLEEVGDGPGQSFYCLRRSDIALRSGKKDEALRFAVQAVKNTPNLPSARACKARSLIACGDLESAWREVQAIEEIGSRSNRTKDGLEKLILYQVRYEYNISKGRYDLCRRDIENVGSIDVRQAHSMKQNLVHHIARSGTKVDPALSRWLKT